MRYDEAYYWVRRRGYSAQWEPALWVPGDGWLVIGSEVPYRKRDSMEIGPRLDEPERTPRNAAKGARR